MTLKSPISIGLAFACFSWQTSCSNPKLDLQNARAEFDTKDLAMAIKSYMQDYEAPPLFKNPKEEKNIILSAKLIGIIDGSNKEKNPKERRYFASNAPHYGKGYSDPGGRDFQVLFDLNNDGEVSYRGETYKTSILVISLGPDGKPSEDDITSKKKK